MQVVGANGLWVDWQLRKAKAKKGTGRGNAAESAADEPPPPRRRFKGSAFLNS
jgi:hypothetical protein